MNLKNINSKTIGLFLSISLLIPSNYGLNLGGINFEDIPIILIFILLLLKKKFKFSLLFFDKVFISFFILFILYSNIFTKNFQIFNQTNIRFYFYFLLSYLCIDSIKTFIDDVVAINNEKVNLLDLQKKRPSFKESLISTAVIEAAHISLENDSKWQIIEMDD